MSGLCRLAVARVRQIRRWARDAEHGRGTHTTSTLARFV